MYKKREAGSFKESEAVLETQRENIVPVIWIQQTLNTPIKANQRLKITQTCARLIKDTRVDFVLRCLIAAVQDHRDKMEITMTCF